MNISSINRYNARNPYINERKNNSKNNFNPNLVLQRDTVSFGMNFGEFENCLPEIEALVGQVKGIYTAVTLKKAGSFILSEDKEENENLLDEQ